MTKESVKVNHELTKNVLDTQLYGRLKLTGIKALREKGITGKGIKIAVLDSPGSFKGSVTTPHYLPYKPKGKDYLRLGIKRLPKVLQFYYKKDLFHGVGIAGLISYLLPEAEIKLYPYEKKYLWSTLYKAMEDKPDIINLSVTVPEDYAYDLNLLAASGINVVSAAYYKNLPKKPNYIHHKCPELINVGGLYWNEYGHLIPISKPYYEKVDVYIPAHKLPVPSGGNTFTLMSGTSIAAPIVTVAAATARSLGSKSPKDVRSVIMDTALSYRNNQMIEPVKVPHFGNLIKALT